MPEDPLVRPPESAPSHDAGLLATMRARVEALERDGADKQAKIEEMQADIEKVRVITIHRKRIPLRNEGYAGLGDRFSGAASRFPRPLRHNAGPSI